jgi:hypothetical protein
MTSLAVSAALGGLTYLALQAAVPAYVSFCVSFAACNFIGSLLRPVEN